MVWSRWLDESNQMGSADASGQEQVEQNSRTSVVHPGTSQRGCLHIFDSFRSLLGDDQGLSPWQTRKWSESYKVFIL